MAFNLSKRTTSFDYAQNYLEPSTHPQSDHLKKAHLHVVSTGKLDEKAEAERFSLIKSMSKRGTPNAVGNKWKPIIEKDTKEILADQPVTNSKTLKSIQAFEARKKILDEKKKKENEQQKKKEAEMEKIRQERRKQRRSMIEESFGSNYQKEKEKETNPNTTFGARTRSVTTTYLTKVNDNKSNVYKQSTNGNTLSNYDTGLTSVFNSRKNSISDRISNYNAKQAEADKSVNIFKTATNRTKKESGLSDSTSSSNNNSNNFGQTIPPSVKPRTSKQKIELNSGDTQSSKPTSDPSDPIELSAFAEEPQTFDNELVSDNTNNYNNNNPVHSPVVEELEKTREKTLEEKIIDSNKIVDQLEAKLSLQKKEREEQKLHDMRQNQNQEEDVFGDLDYADDLGLSETTRKLIKSRMSSSAAANQIN